MVLDAGWDGGGSRAALTACTCHSCLRREAGADEIPWDDTGVHRRTNQYNERCKSFEKTSFLLQVSLCTQSISVVLTCLQHKADVHRVGRRAIHLVSSSAANEMLHSAKLAVAGRGPLSRGQGFL